MRYTDDFIEKVREANNIEDVIGSYVKLQRKGTSYMGLCPFHNEKTPSFSVHPVRQMYHCFGCGASGDVFSFLMEYDRLSFQEAVVRLAERASIAVQQEETSKEQRKAESERNKLLEIQKEAAKYYLYRLYSPAGKYAMQYLKKRGLTDDTIKKFGLGYADKGANGLYSYLKKKGFSDALLKESGLFLWDEKRSSMNEKFWNRVMFPIMDINRKVIGFGGRVMGDAKPKYLNSPETKLFDKSRNLYGLYAAKASRQRSIIICEGYMDVISLHQAGFANAVASLGTALTSQQTALLRKYTKDVYLLYDSDEAGVKAALRAIPLLRSAGLNSKVVNLQPYKDPDELLKAGGAEELQKRIDSAENGFMFEVRKLYESYDMNDPKESSDFYHEAARKLMAFSDEIERNSYLASVARQYHIAPEVLKRQLGKLAMQGVRPDDDEPQVLQRGYKSKTQENRADKAERTMLAWLCKKPDIISKIKNELKPGDFSPGMNRTIAEDIFRMYEAGNYNPVSVLNRFEESEEKTKAAAILEGEELPENEDIPKALGEVIVKIKTESLERRLEALPASDMAALQEIMNEKKKLEDLKKTLGKNS
ncbi:MAG TPA: DNA primase [Candidatus Alectryocaccobium stercorigallinarum]|nr:DNA primase [Candidatus Alectryocaccobium stercorigallinarum]